MNIVIVGAGDVGIYLSSIFSKLGYGIVLIDHQPFKLEQVGREMDIVTRFGSGTDWELLEELMELSPDLFLALTGDDETNLVACTIAKNLGYPQTIARVRSQQYFSHSRLSFERLFSVDYLIGPEKLTAEAIANMILIPGAIVSENFSHGSVQMRTVKIPSKWRKGHIPLAQRNELEMPQQLMVGLIRRETWQGTQREENIIFPHGTETLKPEDEVTFIGEKDVIHSLHRFIGTSVKRPSSVMIVGGTLIGVYLGKTLLEKGIRVRLVEKDYYKCKQLSEQLPNATIINRDGTDVEFLQSERIENVDVLVACTSKDEINFLVAAISRNLGCENVIISLSDTSYIPIAKELGISQSASPRLMAANRILSIAREKRISSMVSMYENQAEIMEVKVSSDSKIAGIPIRQLGPELPKDFLIVVIQSRGRVFIADGSRVLSPGDTVVVISHPRHVNEIRKLF